MAFHTCISFSVRRWPKKQGRQPISLIVIPRAFFSVGERERHDMQERSPSSLAPEFLSGDKFLMLTTKWT